MGVPGSVARKQPQDLINTNTLTNATNTDGEAVGAAIDGMASRDPAQARQIFEKVMEQTPDADERREVARGIAQSLRNDQLRGLAETPDGRKLLERASAELKADLGDHRNEQGRTQIGNAIKAADLKNSAAFKTLDPATQANVLARIGSPTASAAQVDNIVALAKSAGFQAVPPATRKELLSAQAQNGKDSILSQGLQNLANDAAFKTRTPAEQISAISAFSTAARSEAYRGKEAFGIPRYADLYAPATSPSDADKRQILQNAQRVVTSAGFHDVGFDTQKAMMGALTLHATDKAFTGRLLSLVNSPGFLALNDAGKETRLLTAYGKDFALANGVDALVTDAEYTLLAGTDRAKVLTDIVKLAETKSYQDQIAPNRQAIVEVIGNVSARSVADPNNKALRNAVDQVVDGRVTLRFIYEKPGETSSGGPAFLFGKPETNHSSSTAASP